jgi:hypothetical protein
MLRLVFEQITRPQALRLLDTSLIHCGIAGAGSDKKLVECGA